MDEALDPDAFRKFEHDGWNESVAAYDSGFSPLTRQTIPAILEAIVPVADRNVLDVACGPGELSRALAAGGASVCAVDFSLPMIELARQQSGQHNIEFTVDDAETLGNFPNPRFDAVVMNYGILHLGRPSLAIQSVARVLKPGGKFVFSCWQDPAQARGFAIILDAVKAAGAAAPDLPHGPNFFHFSDHQNIQRALTECGFGEVTIRGVEQTWELEDPEALFNAFLQGTARTGGMLRRLARADLDAVRTLAYRTAASEFTNENETLSIPMPALVAGAVR